MKPFPAHVIGKLAIAGALVISTFGTAEASLLRRQPGLAVSGVKGGLVITDGLKVHKAKADEKFVRLAGSCESACTLYLSMPEERICITRNASFQFELPRSKSRANDLATAEHLMRSYPGWVKSWITTQGGLSSDMEPMPYSYASKFLATC